MTTELKTLGFHPIENVLCRGHEFDVTELRHVQQSDMQLSRVRYNELAPYTPKN